MPFHARGHITHETPKIDIHVDNDIVIFRGSRDEATASVVKGELRVTLGDRTGIRHISLVLQGFKRFQWHEKPSTGGIKITQQQPRAFKQEELIFEKKWIFLDGKHTFDMNPGELVYPFQEVLDGSLPESIEGLQTGSNLFYRFKAKLVRGTFLHDIHAKKHLRIVRTLAATADELRQTTSCENLWPNKVEYSLSTPCKAAVFGTSVPFAITLIPLLKGLTIGDVIVVLKETVHLHCPQRNAHHSSTRDVYTHTFTSGVLTPDANADMGEWNMNERLPLPKSLNICVQDAEVPGLKIRHKMKFIVQLHNPDGHISELRASLPIALFISPNQLSSSSQEVNPDENETPDDIIRAPPSYGLHNLDALYQHLPSLFETPFASGANTPLLLSRNNSVENLALHALPDASSGRWTRPAAPHTEDDDEEEIRLSMVPSYNTALRSRPPSPDGELPDYPPHGVERLVVGRGYTTGHVRVRSEGGGGARPAIRSRSRSFQLASLGGMMEEGAAAVDARTV